MDARKILQQALVLPDAYKRSMDAQTLAKAQGTDIPNDLWTNDPTVQEAAARRRRARRSVRRWVSRSETDSDVARGATSLRGRTRTDCPADAQLRQLAQERQDVAAELAANRPNFEANVGGEVEPQGAHLRSGSSLIADWAPALSPARHSDPAPA
jgi:hypothetical protein